MLSRTYAQAAYHCAQRNGSLVTLRNCEDLEKLQQDFVNEALPTGENYHIGLIYGPQSGKPKRAHADHKAIDRYVHGCTSLP